MFRAQQLFEPRRGVLLGTGAHLGGGEPREIERCVQLPTRHVGGREAEARGERERHTGNLSRGFSSHENVLQLGRMVCACVAGAHWLRSLAAAGTFQLKLHDEPSAREVSESRGDARGTCTKHGRAHAHASACTATSTAKAEVLAPVITRHMSEQATGKGGKTAKRPAAPRPCSGQPLASRHAASDSGASSGLPFRS